MKENKFFRMISSDEQELTGSSSEAYYSCPEIEGALSLVFSKLTMCGFMHSLTKGMPEISEYNGGDIVAKDIIDARRRLTDLNQTNADTPCKGCKFLEKKVWKKNDRLIDHITIGHYSICNLRCSYCYISDYTKEQQKLYFAPPYSASYALNSIFKQNLVSRGATAWLTAGEPTLFADFQEIMRILLDNECLITIGTNCIKAFEVIEEGLSRGIVEVLCSVDAGSREKYLEVKGKDRHSNVWSTLSKYAKINPSLVIVKYIFLDANSSENEVMSFISQCELSGIRKISISRDILKYDGILSLSKQRLPEDQFKNMSLLMSEAIKRDIEVFFDVNWPVFSSQEIMTISQGALLALIQKNYSINKTIYDRYFKGFAGNDGG